MYWVVIFLGLVSADYVEENKKTTFAVANAQCKEYNAELVNVDDQKMLDKLFDYVVRDDGRSKWWTAAEYSSNEWKWKSGKQVTGPWCQARHDPKVEKDPDDYAVILSSKGLKPCYEFGLKSKPLAQIACESPTP